MWNTWKADEKKSTALPQWQGSEKLSGFQDIGKTTNKATAYN